MSTNILPENLVDLMKHVLDRLAAGETFANVAEQTGIKERVADAAAAQSKKAFMVIQEGGSSMERYLHVFDTRKQAVANRKSCARAAYRTSDVIEVPGHVAALGAPFYDTVEAAMHGSINVESYSA